MIERLHSWLPLLPLLLLLAATYWLNMQVQPAAPGANKILLHDPDYIIDNFTATTLDEQGKIRFIMSANKMWHYPDDDTTQLEQPRLASYTAERPPLRISAQKGELSSKGEDVYLRDEVRVVRPAYENRSEVTLSTPYLHAVPNKDYAETDQAVTLVDARGTLDAVGMQLDTQADRVIFLSQVKTTYAPVKK